MHRSTRIMTTLLLLATVTLRIQAHAQIPAALPAPELIKPSEADPRIVNFDDANVVYRPANMADAPILLWMAGTGGKPENPKALLRTAAEQGYRVVGLEYIDIPAVSQVCPQVQTPTCPEKFREMRLWGTGDSPDVHNAPGAAIVPRLVALLQLLARRHPDEAWQNYLTKDAKPDWSRIAVAGQSQGAGMAAFIAKREKVYRAVLFSSPVDSLHGTKDIVLPPWLSTPSATPLDRWYAVRNSREPFGPGLIQSYKALAIPPDHIHVFSLDLPPRVDASNPMAYHGTNIADPRYIPEWRVLFGTAGAAQ